MVKVYKYFSHFNYSPEVFNLRGYFHSIQKISLIRYGIWKSTKVVFGKMIYSYVFLAFRKFLGDSHKKFAQYRIFHADNIFGGMFYYNQNRIGLETIHFWITFSIFWFYTRCEYFTYGQTNPRQNIFQTITLEQCRT